VKRQRRRREVYCSPTTLDPAAELPSVITDVWIRGRGGGFGSFAFAEGGGSKSCGPAGEMRFFSSSLPSALGKEGILPSDYRLTVEPGQYSDSILFQFFLRRFIILVSPIDTK
jgi:hypothetical protein